MCNSILKSVIIATCSILCYCEKKQDTPEVASPNPPTQSQPFPTSQEKHSPQAPTPPPPPKPVPLVIAPSAELQREFVAFVNAWNGMPSQFSGKELVAKQRDLAYETIGKLAGGAELTQFLQFLKNKGAVDLHNEIVERGMEPFFRGEKATAMRDWVLSVYDFKMKEQLMLQLGMAFDGPDLKEYFERVGNSPNGHNCQCRLMTGYCSTIAKTDPMKALRVYKEYTYPKRITNAGLAKVMEHVPPTADFVEIAAATAPDSAGLSKNTRRSLLNNWSQHRPSEAAQYVMTNTSVVHADQMAVVMSQWAQKAPAEAETWLAQWDPSPHRDQGSLVLSQHWLQQHNPARAFQSATQIGNFDLRVKTATAVFQEWERVDRSSAEAAWLRAFPQK